jgi:dipeptidyl aminopeptidase/acylaminoacyl peptidase
MLLAPLAGMAAGSAAWTPGFGPYQVGSSCMLAEPATAAPMEHYLIGRWQPRGSVYLDQLISDRRATLVIDVKVPADWPGAGRLAGHSLPVVLSVLYPTPADNSRPEYTFPEEHGWYRLPHMQRPGEAPLFADEKARYPLVIHSGGQNTHGLWHLWKLQHLASHGYITVDVYHGDGRTPGFGESVALRSLAVRAALDHVLAHPHYADHIDTDRIGATGSSAGGLTVLTLLGGANPAQPGRSLADERIKAGFGTVPFAGFAAATARAMGMPPGARPDFWNFGEDFAGLATVKRPWFAISGELDRNVPAADVLAAARALGGPAWVVEMKGQTHGLNEVAEAEARGWEAAFFGAHLRGDTACRALLRPGANPAGPDAIGQMRLQPA